MKKDITRSQIKEIGKRLRSIKTDQPLQNYNLKVLTEWRSHHGQSLKYFAKLLEKESKKLGIEDFTLIQRIYCSP